MPTGDVTMLALEGDERKPSRPKDYSDEEMADLFGDVDGEGDEEKDRASRGSSPTPSVLGSEVDGLTPSQRRQRQVMEYGEEDAEAETEEVQLHEARTVIPNLPLPNSSDGNHWVIRMPNFVKIDPLPFHPETYRGPEADLDPDEQAETLRERSMSIKLEVENTIRWRWIDGEDGEKHRQSNSRLIHWSDGSMSLQLGKELFDVSVNIDNSASIPRAGAQQGAMPSQSHSQTSTTPAKPAQDPSHFPIEPFPSQGLSYLVAQHKSSTILQVEAPITGFLSLRPTGMQSETHRKLVRAVGQKHNKIARLRIAPEMTRDPERVNAEMVKAAGKQRRKSTTGGRRKARDGSAENAGEDSDGGAQKKRKRRSSFGRHRSSRNVYSDDEEAEGSDEDDDPNIRKRRDAGKQKRDPGDYEADDFVVEDPSENEDENSGKTPGRHDEDVGEPDELDKIDRQIEHQSRNRRKEEHKVSDDADLGAGSDDMDMSNSEVEEEDDATTVRKPGTGRKKIVIEDEDEDG